MYYFMYLIKCPEKTGLINRCLLYFQKIFPPDVYADCYRTEGPDLIQMWKDNHRNDKAVLVKTTGELKAVNTEDADYILGLMAETHIRMDDQAQELPDSPSLDEMTKVALEILMKGDEGFFLMVEAARIDHAHHGVQAVRALSETVAMDRTVEMTVKMLEDAGMEDDTLIIVTADHAHTMSIAGGGHRGNAINGLSDGTHDDGLPYTTLGYANGPSYYFNNFALDDPDKRVNVTRRDLTNVDVEDRMFFTPTMGFDGSETHGGDDVAIYARGPMAHLFHSLHDQTHIAYVMAYSACIGPYKDSEGRCQGTNNSAANYPRDGQTLVFVALLNIFVHFVNN